MDVLRINNKLSLSKVTWVRWNSKEKVKLNHFKSPQACFSALCLVFISGSVQADTSTSVIGRQHRRTDASVGLYPVHWNKIVCKHIQSSNYIFGKHKRESTAVIHCFKVICRSQGCKTTPAHMLGSCGFSLFLVKRSHFWFYFKSFTNSNSVFTQYSVSVKS